MYLAICYKHILFICLIFKNVSPPCLLLRHSMFDACKLFWWEDIKPLHRGVYAPVSAKKIGLNCQHRLQLLSPLVWVHSSQWTLTRQSCVISVLSSIWKRGLLLTWDYLLVRSSDIWDLSVCSLNVTSCQFPQWPCLLIICFFLAKILELEHTTEKSILKHCHCTQLCYYWGYSEKQMEMTGCSLGWITMSDFFP